MGEFTGEILQTRCEGKSHFVLCSTSIPECGNIWKHFWSDPHNINVKIGWKITDTETGQYLFDDIFEVCIIKSCSITLVNIFKTKQNTIGCALKNSGVNYNQFK